MIPEARGRVAAVLRGAEGSVIFRACRLAPGASFVQNRDIGGGEAAVPPLALPVVRVRMADLTGEGGEALFLRLLRGEYEELGGAYELYLILNRSYRGTDGAKRYPAVRYGRCTPVPLTDTVLELRPGREAVSGAVKEWSRDAFLRPETEFEEENLGEEGTGGDDPQRAEGNDGGAGGAGGAGDQ